MLWSQVEGTQKQEEAAEALLLQAEVVDVAAVLLQFLLLPTLRTSLLRLVVFAKN